MTDTHDPAEGADPHGGDFVQLFTKHQRRLFLYILAQVANPIDAEEILQETNVIIWRKFDKFELGTNFFAWGSRIASYEVLKFRERKRRDRVVFSEAFMETVAQKVLDDELELDGRRKALHLCLGKLRPRDRELIQYRYATGESGKDVARKLGRPVNSVYQSLGRIRKSLLQCMKRSLAAEAGS
ncbi:MAG: sigma-70 family RNA polymerase sigma factor [Planctomycetes bacterium]|nr:sigma-70 family RNA polymerase sigma factor [Planctomycetota bacterium]